MEAFSVTMGLGDPQGQRFEEVDALVDTGATLTSAPSSLWRRLGVTPTRSGKFRLANGQQAETQVRVEGSVTTTWVLFGDEGAPTLLGAMTLEGLLLGVDPFNRRLVPVEGLLMSQTP